MEICCFIKETIMKKVLIINGPNLNLLGRREENIYGNKDINSITGEINALAGDKIKVDHFQSNHEGEIVDKIHSGIGSIDYIIINPGALAHYSYSICDAIAASKIKTIEVHISNIFGREDWRAKSVISPAAAGVISGFGTDVYRIALLYILQSI